MKERMPFDSIGVNLSKVSLVLSSLLDKIVVFDTFSATKFLDNLVFPNV
jgi:hypothetical protein